MEIPFGEIRSPRESFQNLFPRKKNPWIGIAEARRQFHSLLPTNRDTPPQRQHSLVPVGTLSTCDFSYEEVRMELALWFPRLIRHWLGGPLLSHLSPRWLRWLAQLNNTGGVGNRKGDTHGIHHGSPEPTAAHLLRSRWTPPRGLSRTLWDFSPCQWLPSTDWQVLLVFHITLRCSNILASADSKWKPLQTVCRYQQLAQLCESERRHLKILEYSGESKQEALSTQTGFWD